MTPPVLAVLPATCRQGADDPAGDKAVRGARSPGRQGNTGRRLRSSPPTGGPDLRHDTASAPHPCEDGLRTSGRWALAGLLTVAGTGHFVATDAFLAQVPGWMPAPVAVVYVSGVLELLLAAALLTLRRRRALVGWVVAAFFLVIVPGNLSQAVTGTDAFGLESDAARWMRLAFQPVLIAWALWATGAWCRRRHGRRAQARRTTSS